jgi:hypothetical protein
MPHSNSRSLNPEIAPLLGDAEGEKVMLMTYIAYEMGILSPELLGILSPELLYTPQNLFSRYIRSKFAIYVYHSLGAFKNTPHVST